MKLRPWLAGTLAIYDCTLVTRWAEQPRAAAAAAELPNHHRLSYRQGGVIARARRQLRAGLQHQIKRSLGSAPESCETAACHNNFTQLRFARLCAERWTLARQRYGYADLRRGTIHHATNWIEIILNMIVRKRLYDHCGALRFQCLTCMPRRTDGVRHVV